MQQSQFPAALQDVADHYDRQAEGAEQQPQAAKRLEGAQVGVLHDKESGEAIGRGLRIETQIRPTVLQCDAGFRVVRLDEQLLEARMVREQLQESAVRHEQLGLENRAGHQPGDDQFAPPPKTVLDV